MKRLLSRFLVITLTLNVQLFSYAAGLIVIENPDEAQWILPPPHRPVPPPHWLPRPIHRLTPLEIRSVKATATIKDQIAQTKIEQEFYNPNPRQLEGTFIMPLPKGAHLEKFRMEVNGKMADAELLSADKAKGIYEEIVRKAKDPALLEYLGRDLLKVRIFPIEPNSTKKIEVAYTQLLKSDGGLLGYSIPLNTARYSSTPVKNFTLKLEIEAGSALKTIYSPTHNVEVLRHASKTATIALEQQQLSADKDFALFYSAEKHDLGMSLLTYRKAGEDGYFILFAAPGFDTSKRKAVPKDVIFVFDTSGSMSGKKMEQGKKALLFCIQNLNEEDRFEIIRFSTETEALFNSLKDVSDQTKKEAETFVTGLKTIGGTAINDALLTALATGDKDSTRPRLIVFLTDGLPTVGESSVEAIVKNVAEKANGSTRIFAFGVGTDVNTHLLDRIAEETRAASQYVLPDEDTEVKLSSFFSKINDPVLSDLSLDFSNIKTTKIHPGKLPDLFKGQQLMVLGRYKGEGKSTAKLRGKFSDEAKTFDYAVNFPAEETKHEFIPRLWATRRVGFLLQEIRHRGENGELKEEVTDLARKYGIVTPYTSFLVTEDQPLVTEAIRGMSERFGSTLLQRSAGRPKLSSSAPAPGHHERERLVRAQAADQSGDAAVAGARYNYSLKTVENAEQLQQAPAEVQMYVNTGKLHSGASLTNGRRPAPAQQQFVAGRTFQLEGGFWTETRVMASESKATSRIEFDSKEYWELVAKHPEIKDVLALGTQVRFLLEGKICEIFSANN